MEYTDPDPSIVRRAAAPAASPSTSTRGGDAATQIGSVNAKLAGVTDGTTPERLAAEAVAIRQRVSALADAATKAPAIRAEISRAFATFNSVAPTPEQLAAAEKAVTDAQAKATAANEKADASGTKEDEDAAVKAGGEAADARAELAKLKKKRDDARRALFEALRAVAKKVKEIKVGGDRDQAGTGGGYGSGKGAGTTAGAPAGSPAATAPGTSRSTPAMPTVGQTTTATPGSTKTSGTTDTGDPSKLLSQFGQQAQQPQTQQVAAQPQAAAQIPQQATQPQQGKPDGKDAKHSLATDGVLGVDDIARAIGENTGPMLTSAYAPGASSPISAGNGFGTQYRPSGTPFQGTTAGGTPVQAAPSPTTGTSRTDLVTNAGNQEVSGRSEPARTATDPAPGTRLSSADPVNQTGTRPTGTGTGGMPMSPGMMGAPLAAGAPGNQKGQQGERDGRIKAHPDEQMFLMHGGDTLSEATPGGTIAQNKPSRDDPRRNAA